MWGKKKNRLILYKKFEAEQKKEDLNEQKKEVKSQTKNEKKQVLIPYSIAICSLSCGSGCSHIAMALASYLKEKHKKVFIITNEERILMDNNFLSGREYEEIDCDHIIYDFGCLRNIEFQHLKEVKLCQGKIMLCQFTNVYLKNLANFIRSKIKFSESWIYLFNFVPKKKEKNIADLMEDYQFTVIPLFSPEETKVMEKICKEVW